MDAVQATGELVSEEGVLVAIAAVFIVMFLAMFWFIIQVVSKNTADAAKSTKAIADNTAILGQLYARSEVRQEKFYTTIGEKMVCLEKGIEEIKRDVQQR